MCVDNGYICYTKYNEPQYKEVITAEEFLKEDKACIVIYRNGDETVALDKTTGKKAVAKCSPEDTYDFYTGAQLAFERLTGKEEPLKQPEPLYNGKVVCVKSIRESYLTVGKVYEFVNGKITFNNGEKNPMECRNFKEVRETFGSEFIELVE